MCSTGAWEETRDMGEGPITAIRSGDALFAFDDDLTIVSWNRAAEELGWLPKMRSDGVAGRCYGAISGMARLVPICCPFRCRLGWLSA
jgi:hypothetical protein